MRRAALLLVCLSSNFAFAQPAKDKPKGRIIDPFARMPHPRDGMRLPDPRHAAEKAAEHDAKPPAPQAPPAPAAPAPPQPAPAPSPPAPPPPSAAPSQITAEPGTTTAPVGTFPAFRRSKTPFGVTTMRIKMKHDDTPPTPPTPARAGGTFQVGLGGGWIHLSDEYASLTSPQGTAGLSLGYGGWLTPEAALFLRASAVTIPYSDGALTEGYLGPAFQLWVARSTWVGIGLGACLLDIRRDARARGVQAWGLGGNVRVGHTLFERSGHALDISLELTPAVFKVRAPSGGDNMTVAGTSIGLLVGYQLL